MSDTTIDLPVLGMTCAACVRRVEKALVATAGVTSAEVNLPLSRARVIGAVDLATLAAAIREAGYEVPDDALDATKTAGAKLEVIQRAEREEVGALKRDAAIAVGLAIPLIAIAMIGVAVIAQAVLGTIIVLGPGSRYLRGGWIAVRHRSPDMNTLIALGAGAAWLSSIVQVALWLRDGRTPEVYFEAGGAIIAFVMIGKVLEARARARVSQAVRGLIALAPVVAHREDGDVDASSLAAGDRIAIRPGERLPADGTVVDGTSAIDEAMLTGESLPVDKSEGSPVYAGTLNIHGVLTVRVARAGAETALARIARAVEDAQGAKAPIAKLADRVSSVFVPVVLAIAALTFLAWWLTGRDATHALEIAIPAAVAVGTSRGAELGVLFSGGDALERASGIDVICIDKTGTLTSGTPTLVGDVDERILQIAASVEQASEHPIARAIVAANKRPLLSVSEVVVEPGVGISARLDEPGMPRRGSAAEGQRGVVDGKHVRIGAAAAHTTHATEVAVSIDGVVAGTLSIADQPHPDAKATIAKFTALGITPVMITGDHEAAARYIADAVGITEIHAGVKPTGKARIVGEHRANGHRVAMVGDGINDAPALAAADVGIALGSGADLAAAAADVTILRGGIANVPVALGLARATLRTIRRNLGAAFIYNLVCIPIAAAGLLSPMFASAAMSLSSVTVLVSSLGLRNWNARG
jgi:P-type Cu+ transporter